MEYNAFTEGVELGGLRNKDDIGILICYMLDTVKKPFLKDDLIEIIQDNGLANYFETTNTLSDLIKNGNVEFSDEKKRLVQLTNNGRLIARQLHSSLSLTIRQKAAKACANILEKRRVENENPVTIQKAEGGGYQVTLRVTDGMRDLMSLSLFVPTMTEANHIKRTFHKNPERLYSIMLAAVIGEKNMIQSALKELKT